MQGNNIYTQSGNNVYTRNEQPSTFAYSDGDACEAYILQCINQATDLSTGSTELSGFIRDWPTRYHLSPRRADLLRPFGEFFSNKKILEIGSGCGAITRYLGETGAAVTALEGSYRRASITAARCRDLDNVQVICDNFSQFESVEKFDVITLVGVLEYSNLFISGEHPPIDLLSRTASLLQPGGVLLVAIENKLGLKYLAGAPEDHTGKSYYGIENRYEPGTAITYGKAALEALLRESGFSNTEFYYPFPDYKFPSVILREKSFQTPGFNIPNLILPAIDYIQDKPYFPAFSLTRTSREIIHNKLAAELSNSFLVVAGTSAVSPVEDTVLAYTFSSERKAVYRKQNTFVSCNKNIIVKRNRIHPGLPAGKHPYIVQHVADEAYKKGDLHFLALTDIISTSGWTVHDLRSWALPYYNLLTGLAIWQDGQYYLPGKYVDITPSNILADGHEWQIFDQEWEINEPVPLAFVLFRGLYYSFSQPIYWHPGAPATPLYAFELIKQVISHFFPVPDDIVDDFISRESRYFGNISSEKSYKPTDFRLPPLPDTMVHGKGDPNSFPIHPLTTVTTKLFFQTGTTNFSEPDSISEHFHLLKEKQRYTLRIRNQESRIEKIRIDPAEQTGALKLYGISITDDTGNTLFHWDIDSSTPVTFNNILTLPGAPVPDHYILVFVSDDPMIIVDLPAAFEKSNSHYFDINIDMAVLESTATDADQKTAALLSSFVYLHGADDPLFQGDPARSTDEVLPAYMAWLRQRFTEPFYQSLNEQEALTESLNARLKAMEQQRQHLIAENEIFSKHIDWYHRTYESRSLAGIIKTRVHRTAANAWLSLLSWLLSTHFIRRKYVATYLLDYARENGLRKSISSLAQTFREHGFRTISRARAISMMKLKEKNAPAIPVQKVPILQNPDPDELRKEMSQWKEFPTISVIIPTYNTKPELLQKAIASVQRQVYSYWEICIGDDCSSSGPTKRVLQELAAREKIQVKFFSAHAGISMVSNAAIQCATGEYIALLDHDDELTPDALFQVAKEINERGEADIIYSDECKIDEAGRLSDLFLKPDWSPELLFNMMYVGHLTVYRKAFLEEKVGYFRPAFDFSQDYDLMLRATQQTQNILHIAKVLYYWRITAGSATMGDKPYARQSNLTALEDAVSTRDINASIVELPVANRVQLQIDQYPKVSLIIPTDSFDNLTAAIKSILDGTDYPDYEIVVVTNSALISTMQATIDGEKLQYVAYDLPYNFSDKCNRGTSAATGGIVVFFNDDVRPLQRDWIQNTIEYLFIPGVGGVSPKLVYEDNTIQYAGMVTGVRNLTGTSFHGYPRDSMGYFNFPQLVRNVSVLSGACLAMKKDVFTTIGGFDAVHTPSNHSDVDLSFRILEHGLRCVYTPYATLCHIGHLSLQEHEAKERQTKKDKSDIYLLQRWIKYLATDPYFTAPMRNLLYHDSPEPFTIYAPTTNKPSGNKGHVLVVSHDLSLSGAPIMLYTSCTLLLKEGYFVQVISPTDGPVRKMYQKAGIPVITDALVMRQHPSFYRFAKNFDLIICNTAISWPVVSQMQDIVKTGWWTHEAQVIQLLAQEAGFVETLKGAKNLLIPSCYAGGYIERYTDRFQTIYYGCADLYQPPVKAAAGKKKIIISIIGSIEYRKGQDILIDALAYIEEHLLATMELWIVGRTHDPAFKAALDIKIAGRSNVHYTGEVSHDACIQYMRESDVIISASRDDPFPVVLVEAFCMGKTCIISSHTGVCELVKDGQNGFVFNNENSEELAARISGVLQNPGLLAETGWQARLTYEEHLTLEQFGRQWLQYLETLKTGSYSSSKASKKKLDYEQQGTSLSRY